MLVTGGDDMAAPGDADTLLKAVRLGWTVAEVRGRYLPDGQPGASLPLPKRTGDPLPLQMERDADEVRQTALTVLGALAGDLAVDNDTNTPGIPGSPSFSAEVTAAAHDLAGTAQGSPEQDATWKKLANVIYTFDSHIQDALAMKSDTVACGYQLGRALAECYWALDPKQPNAPQTWTSWSFLLGTVRCREIGRDLGRLTDYFHPYTTAAIAGSLEIWKSVATNRDWQEFMEGDEKWRNNADIALYRQIRNWYELLLFKQDPSTYIKPYAQLRTSAVARVTIGSFRGRIALAIMGIGALIALIVTLGSGAGTAVTSTVLSLLAVVGISTAGVSAGRFRKDLNTDLIAVAITTAPPEPTAGALPPDTWAAPLRVSRRRQAKMARIARNRSLTHVTPN
jgi:hypothetical protein